MNKGAAILLRAIRLSSLRPPCGGLRRSRPHDPPPRNPPFQPSQSRTRDDRGFAALVEREGAELAIFSPRMTGVAWLRRGREPVRDVIRKAMEEGCSLTEAAERQGWEW